MAFTARHNITTALTQDLITAGDNIRSLRSINLANVDSSSSVDVDLIIATATSNFYIMKNVSISSGATLVVDGADISINTSTGGDSLRIKLSSAVPVDVIIKT